MNAVAGSVTQAVSAVLTGAATVTSSRGGDTLSGIAAAYLGDAGAVAGDRHANKIVDPLDLPPGTSLVIPPAARERNGIAVMSTPSFAPRCEVRISGVTLAADLTDQILSLDVETDLDLAGSFSLVLRNSDNTLLDSALLDLGKTVEIHLGYGNDLSPALLGEIAAIEPSFPQDGPPTISGLRLRQVLQDAPYPARAHRVHVHQRQHHRGRDRGGQRADPGGGPDAASARAAGHRSKATWPS